MIKSVPIYDIDDSSMVVNTNDFWWWSWWWAVDSVNWKTWTVILNKSDIWLSNVDNTSDINKPISTATQTALNAKQNTSEKGQANWYAWLDWSWKIPSSQLPSYVDDVIEVADFASLPITGETWKIYTTIDNNKSYRWWGSSYTQITDGKATWWGIDWLLSNQTDLQSSLNNKVDKNLSITWATKTKITYDSKGLVVSWEDATTADIADSTNKRYVTDADLIDIWNLSWINTWDETKATIESKLWADYNKVKYNTQKMYLNLTDWFSPNITSAAILLPLSWSKTFTSYLKGTFFWKNSVRIKFGETLPPPPPPPPEEE